MDGRDKNKDVCKLTEVVEFVGHRRRAWNDQVTRAARDDRLIKIGRNYKPQEKRDPGRLLKRWAQS